MLNDELYRPFFDSPLLGQALCDEAGQIVRCNSAFARFLRYPADQLLGRKLGELLPAKENLPENHRTERRRFLTSDNRVVWGELCLVDLPGTPYRLCQVFDCTKPHLEQMLHKGRVEVLEQLYRQNSLTEICEAIVHYIESMDPGVRCSILQFNEANGTLHKLAAPSLPDFYNDAIDGMRIGDGVGSCGTAVFRRDRVIVSDILEHPYWARARRLVQRTTLRACWSEPIIAHDGRMLGSFALYYDTPREPGSDELDLIVAAASLTAIAISHKRAEETLKDLDRARDEFISVVTHELRTPMTAIIGFSELLANGSVEPVLQREVAGSIVESCLALARIVNDLQDVSVLQHGQGLAVQKERRKLLPILSLAVENGQRRSPLHRIELSLGAGLPEFLECDPGRMSQVLDNLLGNAIKYSPDGGTVVLDVQLDSGRLAVSVTDQGIGMSDAEVGRAFERFFRARSVSNLPGLGLGLCIVRQIVEAHGGTIDIVSRPGAGTRVTFTLPL